ncbi:conjugal transfer pilin signal peptidase TrbI [Modicisalibacter xianhensis]|uniref:Signal peptidase I n=1 Tax=Modicisalibacter xianhensis TaxID=442341 RepID=A0A4R8FKQ2_9GAMM|nr:signal peptidase I [Halomonas xianhensis]TDX26799.1 conjugal transfer pilin signal peptidase TrbI [Halomonas xianhensis]
MIASSLVLRKREPWGRFLIKMALVAAAIFAVGAAFTSRFHFGIDSQQIRCFYDHRFFLVDRKDHDMHRGEIYAFSSRGLAPFFDDGTQVVKILVALPGDHVEVTETGDVKVNGETLAKGLHWAEALGRHVSDFAGNTILPEGAYWFMGETPESFDSRYWGSVNEEQIIGRAYPIL